MPQTRRAIRRQMREAWWRFAQPVLDCGGDPALESEALAQPEIRPHHHRYLELSGLLLDDPLVVPADGAGALING